MSKTTPNTMKAWSHTRAGLPPSVLTYCNLPKPTLTSPTQVLLQVTHCALNPAGSIIMQLLPFLFRASPAIPEMDFSGILLETGSDVPSERHLAPGTRIFGSIPLAQHVQSSSGALAEFLVVPHTAVVKTPDSAELSVVAGLGIAGATALEMVKAARLEEGGSVLVNGASGGIGHLVVQMCRDEVGRTGKVVAVCSGKNVEWIKELNGNEQQRGADGSRDAGDDATAGRGPVQVVDYERHSPVPSYLAALFGETPFDAVIDAVGIQAVFDACPTFLAEGKPYVTVGPRASSYTYTGMLRAIGVMAKNLLWPRILGGMPRLYVQVNAAANLEGMEALAKMVGEGKVRVHVGTMVGMEDAQKAYECALSGHAQGKIVITISGPTEQ
ncbi:Nn.00g074620.m01.CDS01 [Neocucurbitaria sp. VM-36]